MVRALGTPVWRDSKFAAFVGKSVKKMRILKAWLAVKPMILPEFINICPSGRLQGFVNYLFFCHVETAMLSSKALCKVAYYHVVGPGFAHGFDQTWAQNNMLVATSLVDIVVFYKCGCR